MYHLPNINSAWSCSILHELIVGGVNFFYTSPGFRNAPLVSALFQLQKSYPKIKIINGIDERAQAYRALGNTKNTKIPSVLICTSGTAFSNYIPAVIEAKESNTPLIVISADRPDELVWSHANQTIEQTKIFSNIFNETFDIPCPNLSLPLKAVKYKTANILHQCVREKLPCHINIRLREPLDNTKDELVKYIENESQDLLDIKQPIINYVDIKSKQVDKLIDDISTATRPLILVGELNIPSQHRSNLISTLKSLNIPKYVDITSGIKFNFSLEDNIIPSLEHPDIKDILNTYNFDQIIHLGGQLTSKSISSFLTKQSSYYTIINDQDIFNDNSYTSSLKIYSNLEETINFLNKINIKSTELVHDFTKQLKQKENIISSHKLSYPQISKSIVELSDNNSILYLGNSTVIRSFDAYISLHEHKDLNVYYNRGVSGIEGFIASALGLLDSLPSNRVINLVLGDLSFLYDLNSIFSLQIPDSTLNIILVNNNGGGIFTLLNIDIPSETSRQMIASTDVEFNFINTIKGLNYKKCESLKDFKKDFKDHQFKKGINIIEVITTKEDNVEVYQQLKTVKL